MTIRTIINIPREQYDLFITLIGDRNELPREHEEWEKKRTEQIKQYSSIGDTLQFVTVDYNVFTDYLRRSGAEPSCYLLGSVFGALVTQGKWNEDVAG